MISYQLNKNNARKKVDTKNQLLIDKTILCDCRKKHTNLGMAWIDYRKASDIVRHSSILESLEFVQVADNILEFVKISMGNWLTESTSCGENLAKVKLETDFSGR